MKNPFQFDDIHHIKENVSIREIKNIPRFFFSTETFSTESAHKGHYRPLLLVTHAINYAVGGLNPVGYHLVNLAFHVGSAFLVFLIVQAILTPTPETSSGQALSLPHQGGGGASSATSFAALAAALIFAVNPFNSEVVNYISARSSVMASFFYLLAFYFWMKYRQVAVSSKQLAGMTFLSPHCSPLTAYYYYIASLLAFLLGMLTKEILITLPIMLWLYDLYFVSVDGHDRLGRMNSHIKRLIVYTPFILVVAIPYVLIRVYLTGYLTSPTGPPRSYYINLLTQAKVLLRYIQLLFFPINLSIEHYVGEAYSLFEGWVVVSLLLLLLIIGASIWLYYSNNRILRVISFYIVWFFIVMLPTTIIPLHAMLQENRGYLSGVSFAVISGVAISRVRWFGRRNYVLPVFILSLIIIAYAGGTIQRNRDWKDPVTIWSDAVKKSPLAHRAHHNLAYTYEKEGKIGDAIVEYQKALDLKSTNPKTYFNLGHIYEKLGLMDLALYEYKKALEIDPANYKAHNNLGIIYWKMGNIEMAIMEFKRALSINPGYARAHLNLGKIYMQKGETELSYKEFNAAIRSALSTGEGDLVKKAQEHMNSLNKGIDNRLLPAIEEQ